MSQGTCARRATNGQMAVMSPENSNFSDEPAKKPNLLQAMATNASVQNELLHGLGSVDGAQRKGNRLRASIPALAAREDACSLASKFKNARLAIIKQTQN